MSFESRQTVCWNCEETVHPDALFCPYCNADMRKHATLHVKASKEVQEVPSQTYLPVVDDAKTKRTDLFSYFPLILFFMLIGSALFFLGICIYIFAKDGVLTISWQEKSSLSFLGLGVAFMAFGGFLLQMESKEEP